MSATKMGFKVTGRFVTDHARDRVHETDWNNAVSFLNTCFNCKVSLENIYGILSGKLRLEGTNTVEIMDEDPKIRKAAEERDRYAFSGIFFDMPRRSYWKPYAYVNGWGAEDIKHRCNNRYHVTETTQGLVSRKPCPLYRSVPYMNDPREDLAVLCRTIQPGGCIVLFQKVPAPPPWIELCSSFQKAAKLIQESYGLDERNYGNTFMDRPKKEKLVNTKKIEVPPISDEAKQIADKYGIDADLVDNVLYYLKSINDGMVPPEPTDDLSGIGWITPDGRYWKCVGYQEHIQLANRIHRHIHDKWTLDGERLAEKEGWVKVMVTDRKFFYIENGKKVTNDQRDTMLMYCEQNNLSPMDMLWFDDN